jgi:hypothetical protein
MPLSERFVDGRMRAIPAGGPSAMGATCRLFCSWR